jgi:hypothetical protein
MFSYRLGKSGMAIQDDNMLSSRDTASSQNSFSPEDQLEHLLATIWAHSPEYRHRSGQYRIHAPNDKEDPLENIECFRHAILAGVLPVPSVLLFVALAFERYLTQNGAKAEGLSLDDAFGLKGTQRAGNPAKRKRDRQKRLGLLVDMAFHRIENPGCSIQDAATYVHEHNRPIYFTAPSLADYYRKWNYAEVENGFRKMLEESSGK